MQLICHRRRRRRLGCAGFSVVEVLVAAALGLIGVATFLSFNRFQLFALQDQTKQIDLQKTARDIVDLFAREVRRAGMDPQCVGTFSGIASASSTQIRINADLNGDGAVDDQNEDVTYRYNFSNSKLERVTTTSVETLVSDVSFAGSTFRYFDGNGTELVGSPNLTSAQRDAIRRVRIELRMADETADPNKSEDLEAFSSTNVDLRNRFFIAATSCGAA